MVTAIGVLLRCHPTSRDLVQRIAAAVTRRHLELFGHRVYENEQGNEKCIQPVDDFECRVLPHMFNYMNKPLPPASIVAFFAILYSSSLADLHSKANWDIVLG